MTHSRRTRVKFCGMTSAADVALAVEAGADAVGIIVAHSPRRVALDALAAIATAIPPFVARIGVVADQGEVEAAALRAHGFTLQFSGEESPDVCRRLSAGTPYIKVFHVDPEAGAIDVARCAAYPEALWMFDTRWPGARGGSGRAFDWTAIAAICGERDVVVSGGLTPENVADCIGAVRPYAVDVRGGVETDGRKDPTKMRAFLAGVLRARET